jgi:lysophospholipase L1-like esterase
LPSCAPQAPGTTSNSPSTSHVLENDAAIGSAIGNPRLLSVHPTHRVHTPTNDPKVLSLASALPHNDLTTRATTSLRILPLGDSITWGYINGGGSNGYRERLLADLKSAGYTVDFVGTQRSGTMPDPDNQGHPGFTISQIRGVAGQGLASKPNVVLLHAGTNDLNRGNPSNEPDADAPRRLGLLIDDVLAKVPNAVVIVAKIIKSKQAGLNTNVQNFNNALPAIVAARVSKGSKVSIVDMSVLNTSSELSDNLHP